MAAAIVERLTLRRLGPDTFEGDHPQERSALARPVPGRPAAVPVFGGLLLAQALEAAHLSVLERAAAAGRPARRSPTSLHATFLRAARAERAVRFTVERTRDGRAFSSRRVVASQRDEPVLLLQASFQADEPGENYQPLVDLAGLPAPDDLPPGRYDGAAFDCRDVPVSAGPRQPPHARRMWFRARGQLPDDPDLHVWALACATDHGPTRAVREPHADHGGVEQRHSVSLDHSVWFHRPARVDRWLLSELWPLSTGGSRGLCAGRVLTPDGVLVATVSQEALLRLPPSPPSPSPEPA